MEYADKLSWCEDKYQEHINVKSYTSIEKSDVLILNEEISYKKNPELYNVIDEFPNYAISSDNIVNIITKIVVFRFKNTKNYRVRLKDKNGELKTVDARKLLHFNISDNPSYKLNEKYPKYAFSEQDIVRIEDSRVIYIYDDDITFDFIYLKNSTNKYVNVDVYKIRKKLFKKN